MIPQFPKFKKLELSDSRAVDAHTRNSPYCSDFNFTSLWCWDIDRRREISLLNDNLVVKFTDYESGDPFLSYIGMRDNHATINALLDYSQSIGLPEELRLVPEIGIHDLGTDDFIVVADRANFDYVYLTSRLAQLRGRSYKYKRQDAEIFLKSHPNLGFEILDLSEMKTQQAIRSVLAAWRHRRPSQDDQSITHEAEAIENVFRLAQERDIFVGIVTTNGEATAFSIEEIENRIFSMGHFWKVADDIKGEYEYMARCMAQYLESREVTYWNWEQDLGIEALRSSKLSYRPSDFVKKFIITRA